MKRCTCSHRTGRHHEFTGPCAGLEAITGSDGLPGRPAEPCSCYAVEVDDAAR